MDHDDINVKNHLFVFFVLFLTLAASVATLHLIIDPKNIYNLVDIEFLEARKQVLIKSGSDKTNLIKYTNSNCIILGTSRSELGINPNDITGYKCINLSLIHGTMSDMTDILNYAIKHMDLKAVYIGLDYAMFTDTGRKKKNKYTNEANNKQSGTKNLLDSIRYIYSVKGLKRIISLFKKDPTIGSKNHNSNGTRKHNPWLNSFNRNGHASMFYQNERKFIKLKKYGKTETLTEKSVNHLKTNKKYNNNFNAQFVSYQNFIKTINSHEISLYPFISPIHIRQTSIINVTGKIDHFFNWKSRLHIETKDTSSIWDFSYMPGINNEPVPLNKSPMKWYWESQHYKQALGKIMIEHTDSNNPTNKLHPLNLKRTNSEIISALKVLELNNPNVINKQINLATKHYAF